MAISKDVIEILEREKKQKNPAYLTSAALPISFQINIKKIERDGIILENTIPPKYISQFLNGDGFVFQVAMLRLAAKKLGSDGKNIIFHLDEKSIIEDIRQTQRFPFAVEENVLCEILNPFDQTTRLSKSVLDMSASGLSIRTNFDSKLFAPDTNLPELNILIDGQKYKHTSGEVVYKRKLMNLKGHIRMQIGIKFTS